MRTIKDLLSLVINTQVISDPFPEHSAHQAFLLQIDSGKSFLGIFKGKPKMPRTPAPISIHKAYKMGYDKAYQEISDKIGHNKVEGY